MTEPKSKVYGVRVDVADWEAFGERCQRLSITRNAAIRSFIRSGVNLPKPEQDTRPLGFDPITGEPIFKRGVGPQKGKK